MIWRRIGGLHPVRISKQQAQRWGLLAGEQDGRSDRIVTDSGDLQGRPRQIDRAAADDLHPIDRRQAAEQLDSEQLDTDPEAARLVALFHEWEAVEADAAATKREIALRLLEYRPITITELASLIGVSRPTLYAWQREAEERQG